MNEWMNEWMITKLHHESYTDNWASNSADDAIDTILQFESQTISYTPHQYQSQLASCTSNILTVWSYPKFQIQTHNVGLVRYI